MTQRRTCKDHDVKAYSGVALYFRHSEPLSVLDLERVTSYVFRRLCPPTAGSLEARRRPSTFLNGEQRSTGYLTHARSRLTHVCELYV